MSAPSSSPGPRWSRQLLSAVNPALGANLGAFARRAGAASTANGRRVALIGRLPGSGTTTVAAVMALAAAGHTSNRVVVVDTNQGAPTRPNRDQSDPDRSDPTRSGIDRNRGDVGRLLGARGEGRLPTLLEVPDGEAVARRRLQAAGCEGAAVTVLQLPAGSGGFAPQTLDRTLARLDYRSDLTIIDTPSDRSDPVFHAVLHLVDHVFVVLPADRTAPDLLAALQRWLAATPGPPRHHDLAVVLVQQPDYTSRFRPVPRWRPQGLPSVVLRHDTALRAGRPGRMSRRSVVSGLDLVALAASPARRW